MNYPLKRGWYSKKENGKLVYVLAEEDGLVHCEQEGRRFVVLSEVFVKRFEWSEVLNSENGGLNAPTTFI